MRCFLSSGSASTSCCNIPISFKPAFFLRPVSESPGARLNRISLGLHCLVVPYELDRHDASGLDVHCSDNPGEHALP